MATYVMVYLGGDPPATPEEGKAHFERYKAWLASLGDAVVSPANPLKGTQTVAAGGVVIEGGTVGMSGYTLVEAASMDDALEMAKRCPFLDVGGTLEVSELMSMPGM